MHRQVHRLASAGKHIHNIWTREQTGEAEGAANGAGEQAGGAGMQAGGAEGHDAGRGWGGYGSKNSFARCDVMQG